MKQVFLIVAVLALSAAFAEKQSFERYQSIVDRQMFGPLPPGFDPTKSPNDVQKSAPKDEEELTQDQAKLKSAIRFFVIDTKADGTVSVGFTDNSDPKTPKQYYLKVGETRDGWEVKSADPETAKMTIAKGEIEVSLTLGGNSASGGGTSAATPAAASASNGLSRRPGLLGGGGGLLNGGTLRARRLQRQQEAQAQAAAQQQEAQAKEAERQAQAEADKQQREAERAEQRQQLLAIQEELKKVREAKAAAEAAKGESDANNEAE